MRRKPTQVFQAPTTDLIDLARLRYLSEQHPEIRRLCINRSAPVYLLQLELERYEYRLNPSCYPEFQKIRMSFK